jgi:non-ribosomal peptide synthase protein (TIGR01720 family)
VQTWFFDQPFENPHFYNQSALFRFKRSINRQLLEEAFRKLVEYHDSLLINYDPAKRLLFYNHSHLKEDFTIEEFPDVQEIYRRMSREFDISSTRLIKAALIKEKASFGRLFVAMHHLVTDGISWRIFMSDLFTVYTALEKGKAVELFRKTAAMKEFASQLKAFSASEAIDQQRPYWEEIENTNFSIPQDLETDDWRTENLVKISGVLSKEETLFLVKDAHKIYKTDVPILLNAALILTLKEWAGLDNCIIQQESHGRLIGTVDVSRTMGWFTAMYPVKFEWKNGSIGDQIMAVKEELRSVPDHGVGYAIWKHVRNPGIGNRTGLTEIRFNYLGQFDKEFENELFSFCNEPDVRDIDPANRATARLEMNLMVADDMLNFDILYNRYAFREATMNRMRDIFLNKIESVLGHIKNEHELHFTPSDFDTSNLNQEELDALFC